MRSICYTAIEDGWRVDAILKKKLFFGEGRINSLKRVDGGIQLNGKPVHKRKGIALGYLLDPKHTKGIIKKKWGIKPDRIEKLEVEGKTIRITTK